MRRRVYLYEDVPPDVANERFARRWWRRTAWVCAFLVATGVADLLGLIG